MQITLEDCNTRIAELRSFIEQNPDHPDTRGAKCQLDNWERAKSHHYPSEMPVLNAIPPIPADPAFGRWTANRRATSIENIKQQWAVPVEYAPATAGTVIPVDHAPLPNLTPTEEALIAAQGNVAKLQLKLQAEVVGTGMGALTPMPRHLAIRVPPFPKIGIVIGTHASVPYIHLALESLNRHNPDVQVLVHDDCSIQQPELIELCKAYGVSMVSTPYRKAPTIGDASAFAEGLKWGDRNGLDIVVKCSRRFIINKPFADTLGELMHNTQYRTATGVCSWYGFGFCSELVAMHVQSWIQSGVLGQLEEVVRSNVQPDPLPEAWYHHRARDVHRWSHPKDLVGVTDTNHPNFDPLVAYEVHYQRAESHEAFMDWWLMGISRHHRDNGVLWHDTHEPTEYYNMAQSYGLPYQTQDFTLVPGE